MKLLFIENRYATLLWEKVALRLQNHGHEIYWLVQNPLFSPKTGRIFIIPFPNRSEKRKNDSYEWLRMLDRGVRWFGGNGDHWGYYGKKIEEIISTINPKIIFGEPTEFHELIAIEVAKKLNITYIHPSSCRYPPNRFSFYLYDSLEPIFGSNEKLPEIEINDLLERIARRQTIPSYMNKPNTSIFIKKINIFRSLCKVALGWLKGEKYITPSPVKKLFLNFQHKRNYLKWEKIAVGAIEINNLKKPFVLFPLQMQPEANLDVWGAPWSDQADLVRRLSISLQKINVLLVVKPNPKSKYELNEKLLNAISEGSNIVPVSHHLNMSGLLPSSALVVTVTGTVLMECVFTNKPVAAIGNHQMCYFPGVTMIESPDFIDKVFLNIKGLCDYGSGKYNGAKFLKDQYIRSYSGEIGDPLNYPEILNDANINLLEKSFLDIINKISKSHDYFFEN